MREIPSNKSKHFSRNYAKLSVFCNSELLTSIYLNPTRSIPTRSSQFHQLVLNNFYPVNPEGETLDLNIRLSCKDSCMGIKPWRPIGLKVSHLVLLNFYLKFPTLSWFVMFILFYAKNLLWKLKCCRLQ